MQIFYLIFLSDGIKNQYLLRHKLYNNLSSIEINPRKLLMFEGKKYSEFIILVNNPRPSSSGLQILPNSIFMDSFGSRRFVSSLVINEQFFFVKLHDTGNCKLPFKKLFCSEHRCPSTTLGFKLNLIKIALTRIAFGQSLLRNLFVYNLVDFYTKQDYKNNDTNLELKKPGYLSF